jgi:hypothetical protein
MARGPLHIYYHMYLFSPGVWTEGGALSLCPLALALAKTDMWEGHAGQTQANPFGFGIHLDSITCLHVTVLSGIPGICRADCYMHADCYMLYACNSARLLARPLTSFSRTPPTINSFPPSHRLLTCWLVTFTLCVCTIRPVGRASHVGVT